MNKTENHGRRAMILRTRLRSDFATIGLENLLERTAGRRTTSWAAPNSMIELKLRPEKIPQMDYESSLAGENE